MSGHSLRSCVVTAETLKPPGPLAALRTPLYRRVWLAGLVSNVGDWMQIVGRGFLVYAVTKSPSALGAVIFATYIPQLLFLPMAGAYADRYDRRRTLLIGQVAQLVLALALGVLVTTGDANFPAILVVSFLSGTVQAMTLPAQSALTPSLVPREVLPSAIALSMTTNNATRFVGPLLAGLVIPAWGVSWVFYLNALSFLSVIGAWLVIKLPRTTPPAEEQTTWGAIAEGWRFVRRTPSVLLPICVVSVLAAIGLAYQVLGPAYARSVLAHDVANTGGRYYGWILSAVGLGGLAGVLALTGLGRRRPAGTLFGTAVAFSAGLVVLGEVTGITAAIVLSFLIGATHFANSSLVLTLVQSGAPEELRGRVISILMLGWLGIFPITSLAIGAIAARYGVGRTISASGVVCLAASVLLWRWRHVIGSAEELAVVSGTDPLVSASEEA